MNKPARLAPPGPRLWPRRGLVAWLGGLFIAVILALAVYDTMRGYRTAVDNTGRELETQARVIAEQTARSLQAVDVVLRHLASQLNGEGLAAWSPQELHEHLAQQAVGLVQIDGLAVRGATGATVALSWVFPTPASNATVADLAFFQELREHRGASLYVGGVLRGRSDGHWVFPLARPLQAPGGGFGGFVGARGRVDYFQTFYRDVQLDTGTKVTLMHLNGTLLARHPPAEAAMGQRYPLFDAMMVARAAGTPGPSRTISPIDGVERFGAIQTVSGYPLAVLVTRDTAVAMAPWRAQALGSILRTLALGALAALLLAVALRQLARLQAAHASLEASQQRFSVAVAGSDDGIWFWDFDDDRAFASARAREINGLPPGPELQSIADWFAALEGQLHPDDVAPRRAAIAAHQAGLTPAYQAEHRVRDGQGGYRWIGVRGLCVRDGAGRPLRMAGSVSDIDARKRAEAALRRSEERYQLAVEGSNEGLWDWDLTGDLLFLSPRAQEILGLPPGEPLRPRREWVALADYHPDDRTTVREAIAEHLRGRSHHVIVEYRLRHADGEWRWYRQRGIALRDARGRPYRMAGSMEDISARKRAEAERDRLELQLRQAQKLEAIGTLAGGIAHDFNNILSAILGYGEMAQKAAPAGSALRRHIDATVSAGLRAKSLVERILAFSRSGMGERVPVHVQSVVAEALDLLTASLPPGVRLERCLSAGDAGVLGDPTQIHQVVMNLCANAVQAMRSQGLLSVSVEAIEVGTMRLLSTSSLACGQYVRLVVRDTGCGIAPAVLERIFDPFFTTKEIGVGTGLGLSLVHGIVTDLGGGIDVESRPGEGSTFTVYLPWQNYVAAPALPEEGIAVGGGQTVLLVDDEEALVRLGEELLANLGYEPVGFTSPAVALASLRAAPGRFQAVLSDESMPGMTGSELAREVRRLRPDLPVVLMSGYVSAALGARAREAGVLEVLAKPLVARDIARSLAHALQA